MKLFKRLVPWILLAFAFFILPAMANSELFGFSQFRLNLFGRYFSLAFVALGVDQNLKLLRDFALTNTLEFYHTQTHENNFKPGGIVVTLLKKA